MTLLPFASRSLAQRGSLAGAVAAVVFVAGIANPPSASAANLGPTIVGQITTSSAADFDRDPDAAKRAAGGLTTAEKEALEAKLPVGLPGQDQFYSGKPIAFGETPSLRELIKAHPEYVRAVAKGDQEREGELVENNRVRFTIPGRGAGAGNGRFTDPLAGLASPGNEPQVMPTPSLTFPGINSTQSACGCTPPDTNGDVGPNHYVQSVNTKFAVYDKAGATLLAPALQSSALFAGLPAGSKCRTTDSGDPVVMYDSMADRWLVSQFEVSGTPGHQCIAISKTPDPTGAYYAYEFVNPDSNFHDYPHYGVWPDGYYMTDNLFNAAGTAFVGAGVFAFDRVKMLAGDPTAGFVYKLEPFDGTNNIGGQLPTHAIGLIPPPAGLPNRIMQFLADEYGDAIDGIRTWEFVPNYATPASSTFTQKTDVALAAFDARGYTDGTIRNYNEQSGTTNGLDAINDRLMFRLSYRNLGSYATPTNSWTGNFTVNVSGVAPTTVPSTYQSAIRWFELRSSDNTSTMTVRDQGTQNAAPGNGSTGVNNWMGSIAQDSQGNIALGFTQSSSTTFPSIVVAGRTNAAPSGTLNEGEATFFASTGSQTSGGNRWGDYSAMSIDPVDDCTFWYTQEYYATTSTGSWQTRIGKFAFPSCTPPQRGFLAASITNCASGLPLAGATVTATGGYFRTTNAGGTLPSNIGLSPGTYSATASFPGYASSTNNSLVITNAGTTTFSTCLVGTPTMNAANPVTISAESIVPANGAIDPAETVTVSLPLKNVGGGNTTNLVATLQATGGVNSPSGPQTYGVVNAGGANVAKDFTFTASGTCGGTVTMTLALQDGATNLGTVTFTAQLGATQVTTYLNEKFDSVAAPALPAGWTSATVSGTLPPWVSSTTTPNSAPNDLFVQDITSAAESQLTSPVIAIGAGGGQVSFQNLFNMETGSASGFDGTVLEISTDGGTTFSDITAGGNAFLTGGYNKTLSTGFSNPLGGRQAWSGLSGGTGAAPTYIVSSINLPAAAAGQNIKLRWRTGTDSSAVASGAAGVRIDDLVVAKSSVVCASAPNTAPTVSAPALQNILEDGNTGALAVTVGDTETAAGSLVLTGSSSNTTLVPNANIVFGGSGANRTVTVTPVANLSGSAVITLTVTDAGALTGTSTFTVNVAAVNDQPSFTVSGNRSHVAGTTGLQTVAGFVTGTNFGPNETGQAVQAYNVTEASDPGNIVSGAAIATDGTLTYTLSGTGGVATINATLQDNGGTTNGGVDTSAVVSFTITVAPGADLAVSISNGQSVALLGSTTSYTIVVSNAGPNTATAATLTTSLPAELTGVTWTCTAVVPVTCANASGNGSISESVTLASGQSITYTVTGTVGGTLGNNLATSAAIAAPGSVAELNSANNSNTDTDLIVGSDIFKDGFE